MNKVIRESSILPDDTTTSKKRDYRSQNGGRLPWRKAALKSPLPETLVGLAHGDVQVRAAGRGSGYQGEVRKDTCQSH